LASTVGGCRSKQEISGRGRRAGHQKNDRRPIGNFLKTGFSTDSLPRIRGATGPDKQRAATRKGFASAKARGNKAMEQARSIALLIRPG